MWEGAAVDSRKALSRIRVPYRVALPLAAAVLVAAIVNTFVWPFLAESWTYPFNVFLLPLGFLAAFAGDREPDEEEDAPARTQS